MLTLIHLNSTGFYSLRNKKSVDKMVSRSGESGLQLCLDPLDLLPLCVGPNIQLAPFQSDKNAVLVPDITIVKKKALSSFCLLKVARTVSHSFTCIIIDSSHSGVPQWGQPAFSTQLGKGRVM